MPRQKLPNVWKAKRFEYEGMTWEWRGGEKGRIGQRYDLFVDNHAVPRDIMLSVQETEDDKTDLFVIAYWMKAADGDGECCRFCEWNDYCATFHCLKKLIEADDNRKRLDPEKWSPVFRQDFVRLFLVPAWLHYSNLEEGAVAIFEGREPEYASADDFGLDEPSAEQTALFTMAEAPRPQGLTRTAKPVEPAREARELVPQGALF